MALEGRDVYIKTTNKKGESWHSHHRVWDAARFFDGAVKEAAKEGGKVELSNEEDARADKRK